MREPRRILALNDGPDFEAGRRFRGAPDMSPTTRLMWWTVPAPGNEVP